MEQKSWLTHRLYVLFSTVMLLLSFADSSFAASGGRQLSWSMDTQIVIPPQEIAARGGTRVKNEIVDPLAGRLGSRGATVQVQPHSDGSYDLKASASGTVDDFRDFIHTVLKPETNALGNVTEMNISSGGTQSVVTDVVVAANPSTGYVWTVANDSGFSEDAPSDFVMHTRGAGVSQHQVLHLKNNRNSANSIKLVYRRPWEPTTTTVRLAVTLDSLPARLDLSDPAVPAGPAALPAKGTVNAAAFPVVAAAALPATFDWRTSGIVTPVRDQGSCGGCWAFGTVGVMESALGLSGTPNIDLSEQFLISCNNSGWSCNGGLTAHAYHYNSLGKSQTALGAVLESAKPYTATNGTCTTAYSHPYKLSGWQFITPTEFDMPTVDQIKAAISTYGPITAGVCAGSGWNSYTGGVFSTDETSQCSGSTNHQIILVGWDDNGGNGYWILRNSWGPSWGIGGYMYITYNTSRVGEGTSWVTTAAVAPIPTITSVTPASLTQGATSQTVTLNGSNLTGATLGVSGTGVTLGTATVTATQITVPVTVASAAATGARTLTVTTTAGSATATLNITAAATPAPVITGIVPASLAQGVTAQVITLSGSNLTGTTLGISGTGVTLGSATVSATQITVPVTVAATATTGTRTITATTAGGAATITLTITAAGGGGGATTLLTDGFESTGWTITKVSGSGNFTLVASGKYPVALPHGGVKLADFNSYTAKSGNQARIYRSTALAIPATATTVTLNYWMYHDTAYTTSNDRIQPQVSTDKKTWTNVGAAVSRYNGVSGWSLVSIDLSAYKGKTVYLGFLGTSAYGNDIYLDDVSVITQ